MLPAAALGAGTPSPHMDATTVIVAFIAAVATVLAARIARRGQDRSTAAQGRANDMEGMKTLAEMQGAELRRKDEEHRLREADLLERAQTAEEDATNARAEVRRLRSDLAGIVLVINDEVARAAILDAYPDLEVPQRRRHTDTPSPPAVPPAEPAP